MVRPYLLCPFARPLPLPLPFPSPLLFPGPVTAAMVAALTPVATLAVLLLPSPELPWLEPFPPPSVAAASREVHTVSLLAALLAEPGVEIAPRARPWVTLWKFSLTSPSEANIRVTPCLAPPASPCPSARLNRSEEHTSELQSRSDLVC